MKKLKVALVGLEFGARFVAIYKEHPMVESIGIYDINSDVMEKCAKDNGIEKTYSSFEEILDDKSVDAVHLLTPIPLHAEHTIKVLESGKHCACTVPMATSLEDIKRITETVQKTGKNYMMMETTFYTYQLFYIKELIEKGELGKIQFMRGFHYQDMANWPDYWLGLPPMYYGTHAIGPLVALAKSRIKRVICFGSGTMKDSLCEQYNNPFPVESALLEFENGMKAEVTRTLFETAGMYKEGVSVYGSKKTFDWGFADEDNPYITTRTEKEGVLGNISKYEIIQMPNYYKYLPEEIQKFTVGKNFDPSNPEKSLSVGIGGAHHGSHPHLVHEFVMSIMEGRKPVIDEVLGGNITAAGICAHESALKNGESIIVPEF